MDSKYWPKEAILAFEKLYRWEGSSFLDKQGVNSLTNDDNLRRVAILGRLRDSGLGLKVVIEKADAAFEKAYAEGDYEFGDMQFQQQYDYKITFTVLGNNKDTGARFWWPPFSKEFAIERIWVRSLPDKNKSNTGTFWFSKGKRGRAQHFRSKEDVKESFWHGFFVSLLNTASRHNQRQEQKTTKAVTEYEKQIIGAIKSLNDLIFAIKKSEEYRREAEMPCHTFQHFPLSWFMKGFEVQDMLRKDFNLSRPDKPHFWDDTASCSDPREEMLALNRFAGSKYWASGTSVLTGLKEMLEETQTNLKTKKKQRRLSKTKTRGFFIALITKHGWDRDTSENQHFLPANFIGKFEQDPDLIKIATIVLKDDGGEEESFGKQTVNDAIKPTLKNWRGQL